MPDIVLATDDESPGTEDCCPSSRSSGEARVLSTGLDEPTNFCLELVFNSFLFFSETDFGRRQEISEAEMKCFLFNLFFDEPVIFHERK